MTKVGFVEIGNNLQEMLIKTASYKRPHSVLKGLITLADKRYGKDNYILKPDNGLHGGYVVANDGRALNARYNGGN